MNFWKASLAQLSAAWQRYDGRQRAMLVAVLLLGVAAVVGVGLWSSQSEFVPLANGLGPLQTAEMISRLQAAGIEYELSFSGSELLVPKQDWSRARIAAGDLADPLPSGSTETEQSIFDDPNAYQHRLLLAQQETLARSIMRMQGVAQAIVHISRPEPSPFIRNQQPTKASVVLELKPNPSFDRQQAAAVVSMVAHAVEGLDPDNVSITDTAGHILSEQNSPLGSDVARQFEYQRRVETELASKAETMLSQVLGPGRAIVRVAADVDFTQTTRTMEEVDPDLKAKVYEKIESNSSSSKPLGVSGGTASNVVPTAPEPTGAAPSNSETETIETKYETSYTTTTTAEAAGGVKRLTISAAVDIPAPASGDTTSTPALTKDQVESVIKQAVGFDQERNDEIEVVVGPLAGMAAFDPVAASGSTWSQYEGLVRNASLGLASLVVLAIALMTLKKVKPVVVSPPAGIGLTPETARRLNALTQQVEDDPRAIAQVLEAWLGEDQTAAPPRVRKVA